MMKNIGSRFSLTLLVTVLAVTAFSRNASALDGYRDRKGIFGGLGFGVGAVINDGNSGGDMVLDAQLGGGVNKHVTIGLDLNLRAQLFGDHTDWMLVPGPEVTAFITDNLFLRFGAGLAMLFPGDDADETVVPGFDFGMSFGYEFFVSSNVAIDLSVEGNYVALGDDYGHQFIIGFWVGLRFY